MNNNNDLSSPAPNGDDKPSQRPSACDSSSSEGTEPSQTPEPTDRCAHYGYKNHYVQQLMRDDVSKEVKEVYLKKIKDKLADPAVPLQEKRIIFAILAKKYKIDGFDGHSSEEENESSFASEEENEPPSASLEAPHAPLNAEQPLRPLPWEDQVKVYNCSFPGCIEYFSKNCSKRKHEIEQHAMHSVLAVTYECFVCKKVFKRKEHLGQHLPQRAGRALEPRDSCHALRLQ